MGLHFNLSKKATRSCHAPIAGKAWSTNGEKRQEFASQRDPHRSAHDHPRTTEGLGDLEKENLRLRRAISDLTLDKLILQEASPGPAGQAKLTF